MSIFATNAIRDFYITKGMSSARATTLQDVILAWETSKPANFQVAGPQMVAACEPLVRSSLESYILAYNPTDEGKLTYYHTLQWALWGLRHFVTGGQGMEEFVGAKGPADVIPGKKFEL